MDQSKKFRLNSADIRSLGVTLILAAVATIVTQSLELIPSIDFGTNDAVIQLVLLGGLKAVQKLLAGR
jgi:uncharacterized membrane protein